MKKSNLMLMIIAIAIIIVIIGAVLINNNQKKEETIKIGWIGPLTGFGAAWGVEQQRVLNMEVDKINSNGGVNGKKIEIIYEDGKCDPKEATDAAQKLISINNVKVLMTLCSTETLAVAPIANENKVVQIAIWSTNPKISGIGNYTFRDSYSDADIAKIMADMIYKKYSNIGMITQLNDYNTGLSDYFQKDYKGNVTEERYPSNTKDFKTIIIKILENKPQAIILNPDDISAGIVIINQLKELGFTGQLYGNFFAESIEVINYSNSNGMIYFSDPFVPDSQIKKEILDEYISKYGKKPDFLFGFFAQYDAIHILNQSFGSCGNDPECLKNYIHNIKNFSGSLGTYHFNDLGDATDLVPAAKLIINKTVVPYSEVSK